VADQPLRLQARALQEQALHLAADLVGVLFFRQPTLVAREFAVLELLAHLGEAAAAVVRLAQLAQELALRRDRPGRAASQAEALCRAASA